MKQTIIINLCESPPTPPVLPAEPYVALVIVPAERVLLLTPKLPKMRRARLLQAIPFAVEEQLLEDIEQLHFAIGAQSLDGTVPTAVVSKKDMQQWVNLIQAWGVKKAVMIPATLALPYHEHAWSLYYEGDITVVRTGLFQGFACDKNNLAEYLKLALPEAPSSRGLSAGPTVHAALRVDPADKPRDDGILKYEQYTPSREQPINLLQGSFALPWFTRLQPFLPTWKPVRMVAAFLIGWLVFSPVIAHFVKPHPPKPRSEEHT